MQRLRSACNRSRGNAEFLERLLDKMPQSNPADGREPVDTHAKATGTYFRSYEINLHAWHLDCTVPVALFGRGNPFPHPADSRASVRLCDSYVDASEKTRGVKLVASRRRGE